MMGSCPRCSKHARKKDGRAPFGGQRLRCRAGRRAWRDRPGTPFLGHRRPQEVIVTAVRWYCRSRLSPAGVRDLLAERGIDVSPRTILIWVQ
jgi:hypothetical protein